METSIKNLVVMTIKEFVTINGFKTIGTVVYVNKNGYPYVMFIIDKDNTKPVYFSKAAAQAVDAGTPVTKEMLNTYQIGITTNAEGEERFKLVTGREGINLDDLLG